MSVLDIVVALVALGVGLYLLMALFKAEEF